MRDAAILILAILGYIIVSPFVVVWIVLAWLAGGTDHD